MNGGTWSLAWLVLASVGALIWAQGRAGGVARGWASSLARPWLASTAAVAVAALAWSLWSSRLSGLEAGTVALAGAYSDDPAARFFDLLAAGGVLLSVYLRWPRRRDPRGGAFGSVSLSLLGAVGVGLASHASDVLGAWLGLELAAMAGAASQRGKGRGADRVAFALGAFGLLLLFGATADLSFEGLGGRVGKVFNHWGGVQRYVYTLAEGGDALPSGFVAQARGRVITGMAGASLLIPGVLMLCAAWVIRWFDGRAQLSPAYFSRLAALAFAARLFVGVLHAPRLVNEPYGWAGPLIALGLGWSGLGLWRAYRRRGVREIADAMVQVQAGLVLMLIVVAANFYGHRALADRPVAPTLELRWAQYVGDQAMASALAVVASTACAYALLALLVRGRAGVHDLEGLGRSHPLWATTCLGALAWLAGAPGTFGFAAQLDAMQSLMAHSELRWVTVAALTLWLLAVGGVLRLSWRIFASTAPHAHHPQELRSPRAGTRTCAAALLFTVLGGLVPSPALELVEGVTVGGSHGIGSLERTRALDGLRDRRRRGVRGFEQPAPKIEGEASAKN